MFEQISGERRLPVLPSETADAGTDAASEAVPTSVPIVTPLLIGINVLVFLAMCFTGLSPMHPSARDVIPWGSNFGPLTMGGQWWRLFTACFVHFGIVHLALNMCILFQAGLRTERLYGRVRFILLYLLAGLGGNIVSLYDHPLTTSAGASGAIFGVYGALLGFLLIERKSFPAGTVLPIALRAGFFLLVNVLYGIADLKIDISAHLGGLVLGFVAGCLLARPHASGRNRLPLGRTIATCVGGFVILALGFAFLPKMNAEEAAWYRQIMTGTEVNAAKEGQVIYGRAATKADAEALSQGFEKAGFFKESGHVVLLSRDSSGATISVSIGRDESTYLPTHGKTSKLVNGQTVIIPYDEPAPPFPWNDPKMLSGFRILGTSMAPLIGGLPVRVSLLNNKGEVRKTIEIVQKELQVGTNDKVWFDGTATRDDALALGKALQASGFFHDRGSLVILSRGADGTGLSFVLNDSAWLKPISESGFRTITQRAARSIGGPPITIHLVDSTFQTRETFAVR